MRPATANSADGPQNLYEAIALAASEEAKGKGVLAAFSDLILSADRIQKVNCFRTDAFSGRDFGCIGYMQDSVPKFLQYPVENHTTHTRFTTEALKRIPRVEIAYFSADADPEILEFYGKTGGGAGGRRRRQRIILEALERKDSGDSEGNSCGALVTGGERNGEPRPL